VKRFFRLYEWLGPLVLTPLAAWLWWIVSGGSPGVVALAVLVPVIHAYVVPAIGTNVLKVWSFGSRVRIGRFRPQHGFVFGSATACITALLFLLLQLGPAWLNQPAAAALVTGTVLLAINWLYDALAIRHGMLAVYNQPWADGARPAAIAADYVIWFFGVFGLIYGGGMRAALDKFSPGQPPGAVLPWLLALVAATMLVPTLLHIGASRLRHGHNGCRPVAPREAP
jgi:hypothetical protein